MAKPPAAPIDRPARSVATIRDVARVAGVSIGTASKALNKGGRLKDETREKVLAAAATLGYRPNDLAQSLHRTRSMTVGIISSDSFGRFTLPIVEALEQQLADQGIAIFMCNATDDPARERQHLDQLLGKRIDGLVVTSRRADARPPVGPLPDGLPVVYVYSRPDDDSALALIPDDEGGARLACAICSRRAGAGSPTSPGPERFEAVRLRHKGYAEELRSSRHQAECRVLPLRDVVREHGAARPWAGCSTHAATRPTRSSAATTRSPAAPPTRLRERGVAVPEQVAVVGFDNWNIMTDAARPQLSSVDMNLSTLGSEAGRMLLAMMGGERATGTRRLPCTLVVRDSSRSPLKLLEFS